MIKNRIVTSVVCLVLLAALSCSSKRTPTGEANTSSPGSVHPSQGSGGPSSTNTPAVPAEIKSIYTELSGKGCSAERITSEVSSERTCPGIEGYKLLVANEDERDTVTVISPDGRQHPLHLSQTISGGAFDYIGQKAEWRVATREGKDVPVALIIRVDVQSTGDNKPGSYLSVSKIGESGICVTDKIDPVANANDRAREAADSSAGKPCLK